MTIIGNPLIIGISSGGGSVDYEEVISETTIAAIDFDDWGVVWGYEGDPVTEPIEIGATYKVIYNNEEYMMTGIEIDGSPALGDPNYTFVNYSFIVSTDNMGSYYVWSLLLPEQPRSYQTIQVDKVIQHPSGTEMIPTAGDYPVVENAGLGRIANTSLTTTNISITIPVSGTYRLKWVAFRSSTSTSGTNATQLYRTRNNTETAIGSEITTWTNSYYQSNTLDIECNKDDIITVYARSRATTSYVCAGALSACIAQKLWVN